MWGIVVISRACDLLRRSRRYPRDSLPRGGREESFGALTGKPRLLILLRLQLVCYPSLTWQSWLSAPCSDGREDRLYRLRGQPAECSADNSCPPQRSYCPHGLWICHCEDSKSMEHIRPGRSLLQ